MAAASGSGIAPGEPPERPPALVTVHIGPGTLSVWRDAAELRAFASQGAAHTAAIRRTKETGWYAEEVFARFGVVRADGSLAGRDPLT